MSKEIGKIKDINVFLKDIDKLKITKKKVIFIQTLFKYFKENNFLFTRYDNAYSYFYNNAEYEYNFAIQTVGELVFFDIYYYQRCRTYQFTIPVSDVSFFVKYLNETAIEGRK